MKVGSALLILQSIIETLLFTCTGVLQLSLVQQVLQKLPKKLIFFKNQIHLSRIVGQGMYKNGHSYVHSSLGH